MFGHRRCEKNRKYRKFFFFLRLRDLDVVSVVSVVSSLASLFSVAWVCHSLVVACVSVRCLRAVCSCRESVFGLKEFLTDRVAVWLS